MKILHIIRSVDPEGGGPIEGVIQLSRVQIALGHDIEILSLDAPDASYIKDCPLTVHSAGPGKGIYGYSSKIKTWLTANAQNYDVFIINGLWQYHSYASHRVLKSLNRRYYVFTHGMLDPWFKDQYPLKHLKKWLYWPLGEYPVIRDAEKVLFTCEDEKILARQSFWLYRCNEQVVNFGTAGHSGNAEFQRRLFFDLFPQLENKPYLLYLSRIHPKKGLDLLIEAFANVYRNQSDMQLVIAGPDQIGWQAALQNLAEDHGISDRITWTGMLKDDIKWGAYQSAEAFILPSHQENFGIVVAEALSCSLPVLISNKVNIWQEIEHDNAGLVETDNVSGCTKLLSQWKQMADPDKAQMRSNAHHCFNNRFEINKAAMSLLNVITSGI
jgi:glycosyltransferase involved in cell wall biosynthesis